MSEDNINIPFELEHEIIKRLPAASLIRFRSVSKAWKSLIDSSGFIADYSSKVHHLFVRYYDYVHKDDKYDLIVDDHTFPQQRVSATIPKFVKTLERPSIICSSHGLLCIYGYYRDSHFTEIVLLWNVSIRKVVSVVLPKNNGFPTDIGFGVCSKTNDLKIVIIRDISRGRDPKTITSWISPWEVKVFTLSKGVWRRLYNNLPRKSVILMGYPVVIDGSIYWLAMEGERRSSYLIVSFDITSEEFGEVNLPHTLAHAPSSSDLDVSELSKSLVVIRHDGNKRHFPTFVVWMMGDGNSKSFTKQFSIYTTDFSVKRLLQFRKSGEPVLEISERDCSYLDYDDYDDMVDHVYDPDNKASLVVYEPYSKRITNRVIDGQNLSFFAFSYMETLLLHDQPNFVIYDKGKRVILDQRAAESKRFLRHARKKLNL